MFDSLVVGAALSGERWICTVAQTQVVRWRALPFKLAFVRRPQRSVLRTGSARQQVQSGYGGRTSRKRFAEH